MIKQYIKQILKEEYKFDNIPLSKDLIMVIVDKLLENPGKKIELYNSVILWKNIDEDTITFKNLRKNNLIKPKLIGKVLDSGKFDLREEEINEKIYAVINNIINTKEFEKQIIHYLENDKFKPIDNKGGSKPYNTFSKQIGDDLNFMFVHLFQKKIVISLNIPGLREQIHFYDKGYFRNPDNLMEEFSKKLSKIEEYIIDFLPPLE